MGKGYFAGRLEPGELDMTKRTSMLLALTSVGAAAFAFQASAADTITAIKADKAPNLAAGSADPAWAKAEALTVPLFGGVNFKDGKTTAVIKAVYSGDTFYMLLQYDDPTQSMRRFPY